jgi:hypothetical protein
MERMRDVFQKLGHFFVNSPSGFIMKNSQSSPVLLISILSYLHHAHSNDALSFSLFSVALALIILV